MDRASLLIEALSYPASPVCRRLQASLAKPWLDGAFSKKTAAKELQELLRKELAALWYVLDTPTLACTGLARGMLLVEHSIYLRTLLETLAKQPGARPPQQEIALALEELESKRPLSVGRYGCSAPGCAGGWRKASADIERALSALFCCFESGGML